LLNAIAHKDYSGGTPIQISVYDHKIVIWNAGQLPETWTLDRLLGKHPSHPYNRLLANAFFRSGYIESWGRGIEKIHRECREHDIPVPHFDYEMSGLMLTFSANPLQLKAALGESSLPKSSPKSSPKTEEKILALIRTDAFITTEQLGEHIGIGKRAVLKQISKLKEHRRLERVGPAKGGHWRVLEERE
jgi:ATP-dependent DNA helicase RecG